MPVTKPGSDDGGIYDWWPIEGPRLVAFRDRIIVGSEHHS